MTVEEPPTAWRERKKALLRDAIVANAVRLFGERGYDEVSLDEIVDASSCSRSTFHRYFGTKEDLLFPGVEAFTAAFVAELESDTTPADAWELARDAAVRGLHGFTESLDPELQQGFARLWADGVAARRRYQEIVLEWEDALVAYFGRVLGPASVGGLEPALLASLVTSALRAALNHAVATGEDVDRVAERAFGLVEHNPLVDQLRAADPAAV